MENEINEMKALEAKSPISNAAKHLKGEFKFCSVDFFIRSNELAFRKLKPPIKLTMQKYLDKLSKKININQFISKTKPINKDLLNRKSDHYTKLYGKENIFDEINIEEKIIPINILNTIKNNRQDEYRSKLIQEVRNKHKIFPQIGQYNPKYTVIEKNIPSIDFNKLHSNHENFNNQNKKRKKTSDNKIKNEKFQKNKLKLLNDINNNNLKTRNKIESVRYFKNNSNTEASSYFKNNTMNDNLMTITFNNFEPSKNKNLRKMIFEDALNKNKTKLIKNKN